VILVSVFFIYTNYTIESATTHENDTTSFDEEESDENNAISEDIKFPNTIILTWPDEIIDYHNVTFTWTGEDDITQIEDILYSYKMDGETNTWSSWTHQTSKTYINLPDGEYTFFVRAKDQVGNIDPIPVEEQFTVNSSIDEPELQTYYVYWPVVTKNLPLNNTYFAGKKQPFLKTISIPHKNLKQIKFQLSWEDDITSSLFHFGKDRLTFLIKSSNDTKIYSEKSREKGTLFYNISSINQEPTITKVEAESLEYAQTRIQQYSGTELTDDPFYIEVEVKIGELRILRRLRDHGNEFTLKITYEYYKPLVTELKDNPPETSITSGPSGTIHKKYVEFSWKGVDDFTSEEEFKYSYKLKPYETAWSEWTTETSVNYEDLAEGEYTFFVQAIDHRGNIDQTPSERSFIIEKEETSNPPSNSPPETQILTGPDGITTETSIIFTWIGSDDTTSVSNLRYSYKLEGIDIEWSSWTYSTEKTYEDLSYGEYIFYVKAIDESGDDDPSPAQQSFYVEQWDPHLFVTDIVAYSGPTPEDIYKIEGGPRGCGSDCGSMHTLKLGNNGLVTVVFDVVIVNGVGDDFIVFENPFLLNDTSDEVFAELVYVEVSSDNVSFARFPSISTTAAPVGNQGINIHNVTNLGGVHPVLAHVFENNLNPFNPEEAGGDPFNLDDLLDDPLVQDGLVDLDNINYIRLIDIPGDGSCLDSLGNPIYDPTEPFINGADIDAISIINYQI
ncbi:MAG: hypothetical protein DRN27_07850, partial [Thermoplasmata archaeon]